ncbi:MAG: hemerythrin family protein [Magnetococcales bacterium]|nr:hemerythrin family protein [Magnetococcales bacterium]
MSQMVWKDEYSVGIGSIDDQHKRLFQLFGQLMDAIHSGDAIQVMDDIFLQLKGYVTTHFRFEEQLMRKAEYPEYEAHKAGHEKIKTDIQNLRSRFHQADSQEAKGRIVEEVVDFMTNWLTGHILSSDMDYSPYLKIAA